MHQYRKYGEEPMADKLTGPQGELTKIPMLNGHITLSSEITYQYS